MAAEDAEGGAVSQREPGEGGAPEAARRRGGVRPRPQPPGQGEPAFWAPARRLPNADPDADSQARTETTADLNVLHERRSKTAAEGYERREAALKRAHEEEKSQLTETFQAAQDVLKVTGRVGSGRASCCSLLSCVCVPVKAELRQLSAELQDYNQLKKRAQDSTFHRDLQRNIQVTPPGGRAGHGATCCCSRV